MNEQRLIDANILHDAFDDEGADLCLSVNMENMWGFSYDSVHTLINKAPTADAVPVVHGHWILKHTGHGHYWECSECHKNPDIYVTENTKFCPNCGAKMDEEH